MSAKNLLVFPFLCCVAGVFAQINLPMARNLKEPYLKQTRTPDGKPGKNYWQNSANYDINVNFDPVTRFLSGTVIIDYTNNSPDTLKQIGFKLYPNLYKKGSARLMPVDSADLSEGVKIEQLSINGIATDVKKLQIAGTNMTVAIPALTTGQHIQFALTYAYTLNKHSHIRTGEIDPGADFVAYFFPRIAVYDDIDGWNKYPYLGKLEFYNDFCHFKAAVTVPANQVVWATGNLINAKDVLSPTSYQRLGAGRKNDAISTIIDSTEFTKATNHLGTTNTWRFEASDVTDFVFACSDHYLWYSTSLVVDSSTGRRTRVDVAFNPVHKDYFPVINDARKTVEAMSFHFPKWPFPYPHITVFDGLDQMEYPMMVNDNPVEDRAESIELTDHEIFHTMFPFYVGTNETKYAWMDEGWATIGEWIISPLIDSSLVDEYGVAPTENNAGKETDLPIMTLSTEISAAYFTNAYPKPAMGYLFVKDMLGDKLFYKGFHYYIQQWHGKHPIPHDFFNCMNTGSGKNMNWFWKKWFFDNGEPDLAITKVNTKGKLTTVVITSKGVKPVPVDLSIYFSDNTSMKIHKSIAVWEKGNSTVTIPVSSGKKITRLQLGSVHTPDTNKKDNDWEVK
ncbi:MAG: M1 family metallopeptidase [Chitinophagaceae bacterium]|nr:M1 family metallopeptidase [Chitinophagaceae bacterium]